jgi:AcrR family transcriptional regulator
MPSSPPRPARAGRPRDTDLTAAVRQAAIALACDGGIDSVTIERVAAKTGVAKTSIYRRWPNAAVLIMDAFLAELAPLARYVPRPDVTATMRATIRQLVAALAGPRGQLLRHLLGSAQSQPQLQEAFWTHWIEPRRRMGLEQLRRAQEAGQLRADADLDVLLDTLYGAVYYRLAIPYAPLNARYVDQLVEQVFAGVLAQPRPAVPRGKAGRAGA